MVFFEGNYWQKPTSGKSTPKQPATPETIAAMRRAGQQPTPQQIQEALAILDEQTGQSFPSADLGGKSAAFGTNTFENMQDNTQSMRDNFAAMNPNDVVYQRLKTKPAPPTPSSSTAKGGGDIFSGMMGIAKIMQDAAGYISNRLNQPESIEDLIARISGQYPQAQYSGPTGDVMAQEEFAPQFQILKQMMDQANSSYTEQAPQVKAVYDDLLKETLAGRTATQGQYNDAVATTNKNYGAAADNVSGNYTDSMKSIAQELQKLGITEGIGDLTGKSSEAMTNQLGYLAQNQETNADLYKGLGANSYAYDTRRADVNREQGIDAQSDLYQQLQQRLSEMNNQKLGLTAQQEQTANAYDMQIQEMLANQGSQRQTQIMDMVNLILQGQNSQADRDLDLARFGLEQDKFNASQSQQIQPDYNDMNPYQALQARAMEMFGGDEQKARQAAEIILQAYMENPSAMNVAQLLEQLGEDTRKMPGYQDLAFDFYSRLLS